MAVATHHSPSPSAGPVDAPERRFGLAAAFAAALGDNLPVRIECFDGSAVGPDDAPATVTIRTPAAIRYILGAPGDLGFGRAYVSGAIEIDGDIFAVVALAERLKRVRPRPADVIEVARLLRGTGLRQPPIPAAEARLHGRRHTRSRDAAAISHHYDVSNDFYRTLLGPSMTYSCAVWPTADATLEEAQRAKYDLVCRKLDLRPGMRLLDVGCGWGGMALHAARRYGVEAVGVTLSAEQAEWARERVREAGLGDQVEIRYQDYRDVRDGPFDAISSIGMFEHVGLARLDEYFRRLYALLPPGGRLLNHGIAQKPGRNPAIRRRSFVDRYVFPDGELHEVGQVVSRIQNAGLEVRNVENLREHYDLTLRHWVRNLEDAWEDAVAEVGMTRARVWRLYMAASAASFEAGRIQLHQVLAVRSDGGRSGMPLRPDWMTDRSK